MRHILSGIALMMMVQTSASLAQDSGSAPSATPAPTTQAPESPVAKDCGFPPQQKPVIPAGELANRTQMDAAIAGIRAYGTLVNNYLNCLEGNRAKMFYIMNKEQQDRWVEDFNTVADGLEQLQNQVNAEIRAFNKARNEREAKEKSDEGQ